MFVFFVTFCDAVMQLYSDAVGLLLGFEVVHKFGNCVFFVIAFGSAAFCSFFVEIIQVFGDVIHVLDFIT